jgi:hypothetical protein
MDQYKDFLHTSIKYWERLKDDPSEQDWDAQGRIKVSLVILNMCLNKYEQIEKEVN